MWLLACLVAMQGTVAGAITVLGPAHFHRAASNASLLLNDFRRVPLQIAPRATHSATAFGHFHGADTPLRHFHPRTDVSVVPIGDGGVQEPSDADEMSISPTLSVFVALLPTALAWLAPAARNALASRDPWPSLTHDPEPLERPPRPL